MLPIELLDKLLIFYIIFKDNNIISFSKNFKPEDVFLLTFDSPRVIDFKESTMINLIDKSIYFTVDIHRKKFMKGQFIKFEDYFILAFSPLIKEINDLKRYNISLAQMPKHSIINEMLLSLQVDKEIISNQNKQIEDLKQNFDIAMNEMNLLNIESLKYEKSLALGNLISGIAHEINNPMSVIKTNNDLLRNNLKSFFNVSYAILGSLNEKEKNIFNEIIEKCLNNKEKLTYKEQRNRKKLIEIEITHDVSGDEDKEWFSNKFLNIGLLPPYSYYLKEIENERLKVILKLTEKIVNYNDSFSLISSASDKISRIIFSLKNYNNDEKTLFLSSEIEKQIISILEIYDGYIIGKILIYKDWTEEIGKIKISEELIEVWKILIHNSIMVPSFFRKEIKISIKKEDNNLIVDITDNGQGIKDENKEKIFTAFFTTKNNGEGIGLGLYTAKKIVNAHNGDIIFNSDIEETTFRVSIPI